MDSARSEAAPALAPGARPAPLAGAAAPTHTPLLRNAYAWFASSGVLSVLGVLYWVLAARYYSVEAVGLNSAAISTMMFLSGLAHLHSMGVMVRFVPRAGRATGRLIGYAYLLGIVLSLMAALVFVLGLERWAPALGFLRATPSVTLNFILATAVWSAFSLEDYVLTGLRQAIWVPIANITYTIAKVVMLVVLAGPLPLYGIVASWLIPALVVLVPVTWLIFRRLIPRHMRETEASAIPIMPGQLVRYAAGNYLGSLFALAAVRLLPLLVAQQAGVAQAAFFYLPWTVATSIQLIVVNMALSLTVEGVLDEARLGRHIRQFLVHIVRLLVPLIAVVMLTAPWLLRLSGAQYAAEGTVLLRLLGCATLVGVLNSIYVSVARARRQVSRIVAAQALLSLLTLTLSYWLLPVYGIVGVGWAALGSEALVAAILYLSPLRLGPQH
jgi:O-antigen/teichoic acid export membrane protein